MHLPRAELHQRYGDVLRGGLFLPRTDHTAHAICAVLAKAFEPSSNPSQSNYLGEAMYGLLGAMLYAGGDGTDARHIDAKVGSAQLLERALNYVETKFFDSDLSIKRMASDLNVSSRQLQRAFLSMNTTPTDYLVQKRLTLACKSLKRRQTADSKPLISTIAYNCGFNDLSYFNRLFRSTFGCTPTQYADPTHAEESGALGTPAVNPKSDFDHRCSNL
jgi:AraC-like DNA-binding protein